MTRLQRRKLNGRPAPRNKNRLVREHETKLRFILDTITDMMSVFRKISQFAQVTAKHIDDIENRLNKKGI